MKNFKTIYNEKDSFLNGNAWNYYFKNINNYNLNEVYQSQNVILSGDIIKKNNYYNFQEIVNDKNLKKKFKKFLKNI